MDVAYAFLNHHHSIWINGEQFCIWHSYFTDNMQNLFTYTHIDCLIYRKGEKNDAKNAPFTWTRTEPKAENLVQLIESKVSFVVPFNSDCELRLCRARFSQESLGMFSELRGIPHCWLGPLISRLTYWLDKRQTDKLYFSIISLLLKCAYISAQRSSAAFPLAFHCAIIPAAYALTHIVEIKCWMLYSFYEAFS